MLANQWYEIVLRKIRRKETNQRREEKRYVDEPVNAFDFMNEILEDSGESITRFDQISGFLDHKARKNGIPIQGQFELTPLCNFSCRMCYAHLTTEQLSEHTVLPVFVWKNLMKQAWKAGMIFATLTGGECLAYPEFDELFLYLQSLGCEITVLTNGFLLDDERIRFFRKHMPAKIQITLYGCSDDVYERVTGQRAFNTVINNIQKSIAAKLPVIVNVTPNRYLGEDVFETIRIAKSLCKAVTVNSGIFSPREETGRSGQQHGSDLDTYIRIYRFLDELEGKENLMVPEDKLPSAGGPFHECSECGLQCGGGRSYYLIDWHGTMMPCNRMTMIRSYPLEEGFLSAWKKINNASENWPRVPECVECPYERVCNNCAGNMQKFIESGTPPTSLCEETKALVRNGAKHIPDCE